MNRYGIPFVESVPHPESSGLTLLAVGSTVKRIYLLGMTESAGVRAWTSPKDYSQRFFVGDRLGNIRLDYADGSAQVFPLILGESVWWGKIFYNYPDPFPTDAGLRSTLSLSLHLFPAAPVEDGNYVAVIDPRPAPIVRIEVENSSFMKGGVTIAGVTVETADTSAIPGATELTAGQTLPQFAAFERERPLRQAGSADDSSRDRLEALSYALYSNQREYVRPPSPRLPPDYTGAKVAFRGPVDAAILENAFAANVQDMLDKIDPDGMYHTSTRGAVSWNGAGFGTFRPEVGMYYGDSWSRDMGRTLQELAELDYLPKTRSSADYALRMAQRWEDPALKYHGESLPPHWSRVINKPSFAQPFENDGHGLISLSLYKLWQRIPDREAWLRAHWGGVKAAGDWIPWQFDHPQISGAANGLLGSTGESAGGNGHSVYPDTICMIALQALAKMADSIGQTDSAQLWRQTAEKMRKAITAHYIIADPKYGKVWTLEHAGWPNQSTVLGPLIFTADYQGLAPDDIDAEWRQADYDTYKRLVDTYYPFGFYGWAMGYGQGFVTQSALLLDQMRDATTMLDWAAKEIYDPRFGSFVTPEGVQIDPSGRFWYRTGDLGNGVQEAEIVKMLRLVVGVDDSHPRHLAILPRMPYGWTEIRVDQYPALVDTGGGAHIVLLSYDLKRAHRGMSLVLSSNCTVGPVSIRIGPFAAMPQASDVLVNGGHPADASVEKSGDSWWVNLQLADLPRSAENAS